MRDLPGSEVPQLTDRQRECVRWLARGKSDGEIGEILDVSEETVTKHLKLARERYGVERRTSLAIRALFDGTLSFADIFALDATQHVARLEQGDGVVLGLWLVVGTQVKVHGPPRGRARFVAKQIAGRTS